MKRLKPATRTLDATHDDSSLLTSLPKTLLAILFAIVAIGTAVAKDPPLSLHPDNPHYFLWRRPAHCADHFGRALRHRVESRL